MVRSFVDSIILSDRQNVNGSRARDGCRRALAEQLARMARDVVRREIRAARDAGRKRRRRNGARDGRRDARGERARDDVILIERILRDQRRDGLCRRNLHLEVDVLRAHIERAAEDAREREEVVDLVREVRAPPASRAPA